MEFFITLRKRFIVATGGWASVMEKEEWNEMMVEFIKETLNMISEMVKVHLVLRMAKDIKESEKVECRTEMEN